MARLSRRGVVVFWMLGAGALLVLILSQAVRSRLGSRQPTDERREVFRERSLQSGLAFHMSFLPGEHLQQLPEMRQV